MLGQGEYSIKTVSLKKESVESIGGFHVIPDYDIQSVPDEYEALILIGGMTWRKEEAKNIKTLVQNCLMHKKILGGICDASGFLGTVGALNTVKHTGNRLNDLKQWAGEAYNNEKNYVMEQAIRDQNIITANGTAPLEFAKEVLLALKITSEDKISEWYNFHKFGYYKAPMPNM